jgi:ubiquitin carboxyl-terminal hydrolase 6/32
LEVVPPAVYAAVHSWYGGGPKIMRKVVPAVKEGTTELELFPLFLKVCTCDSSGKPRNDEKEYLFSKTATIADMIEELAESKNLEAAKVRLWNYAKASFRDQYIFSPEITLKEAALQEGQLVLMELSLSNGMWPRSQLHSQLLEVGDKTVEDSVMTADGLKSIRINSGKVGLDNLGNTCYMNSSLQALLHTDHLMDFFLSQTHMQHINVNNKHGHGGRLAYQFGRLATEAWATTYKNISPRTFCGEVAALNSQFAGHLQQDAQELLDFLLVGLSEDLNLVEDKPYVEMPDSDGIIPEAELADIWWDNHQKRDLSVITSLFSGQFKSSTVCSCGHSSARYEPFSLLSVAIPEDTHRTMTVHIFLREVSYGIQCRVSVPRVGTLESIIDAFTSPEFQPPLTNNVLYEKRDFVATDVAASRIKTLLSLDEPLRRISDSDNIFFFEIFCNQKSSLGSNVVVKNEKKTAEDDEISDSSVSKVQVDNEKGDVDEVDNVFDTVPIAFVQRKIRLSDGGGLDHFQLCVFGLPMVELLKNEITGTELYNIVNQRVKAYLKGTVTQLKGMAIAQMESDSDHSFFEQGKLRPIDDEKAVGDALPPYGFVLRTVIGNNHDTCHCSRCPWLSRCSGCFIPQNDEVIELLEGETIAVDWHMVVFEEMVDTNEIMKIQQHESAWNKKFAFSRRLPLARCLEKFTENERLEGCVCPKCLSDENMKRHFKLWRLPPVLVVQLKRFQFDATSRRKLNNHVDFPQDGLNLEPYLAEALKQKQNGQPSMPESVFQEGIMNATKDIIDEHGSSTTLGCTEYDLYAVVHHVGALSGGHYVTTIRESRRPNVNGAAKIDSNDSSSSSTTSSSNSNLSDRWWLYNDGQVTALTDNDDVTSASAYVLFYKRRDTYDMTISELFPKAKDFKKDRTDDFVPQQRSTAIRTNISQTMNEMGRRMVDTGRRMTGTSKPANPLSNSEDNYNDNDNNINNKRKGPRRNGKEGKEGKDCMIS